MFTQVTDNKVRAPWSWELPRCKAAEVPPVKVKRPIKDKERDGEEHGKVALQQRRQVTRRAGHGVKGRRFDWRRGGRSLGGGPIFRGSRVIHTEAAFKAGEAAEAEGQSSGSLWWRFFSWHMEWALKRIRSRCSWRVQSWTEDERLELRVWSSGKTSLALLFLIAATSARQQGLGLCLGST